MSAVGEVFIYGTVHFSQMDADTGQGLPTGLSKTQGACLGSIEFIPRRHTPIIITKYPSVLRYPIIHVKPHIFIFLLRKHILGTEMDVLSCLSACVAPVLTK
jgi:hypothetical protein